jgi:creatinine amidohydrolase/Fe(II)-dependent formamide hydrolase-like protein
MMIERRALVVALFTCAAAAASPRAIAAGPWLDDLTSVELRELIAQGTTTVLLPIGGTEQNGGHLTLGKHNVRVRVLTARIAEQLGHAVVAPVLAYVPEGNIDPPSQHMRYSGTVSVPTAAFESVLAATAFATSCYWAITAATRRACNAWPTSSIGFGVVHLP